MKYCENCKKQTKTGRIIDGSINTDKIFLNTPYMFSYVCSQECYYSLALKTKKQKTMEEKK